MPSYPLTEDVEEGELLEEGELPCEDVEPGEEIRVASSRLHLKAAPQIRAATQVFAGPVSSSRPSTSEQREKDDLLASVAKLTQQVSVEHAVKHFSNTCESLRSAIKRLDKLANLFRKHKSEGIDTFPACLEQSKLILKGLRSVNVVCSTSRSVTQNLDVAVSLFRCAMNYRHYVFDAAGREELAGMVQTSRFLKVVVEGKAIESDSKAFPSTMNCRNRDTCPSSSSLPARGKDVVAVAQSAPNGDLGRRHGEAAGRSGRGTERSSSQPQSGASKRARHDNAKSDARPEQPTAPAAPAAPLSDSAEQPLPPPPPPPPPPLLSAIPPSRQPAQAWILDSAPHLGLGNWVRPPVQPAAEDDMQWEQMGAPHGEHFGGGSLPSASHAVHPCYAPVGRSSSPGPTDLDPDIPPHLQHLRQRLRHGPAVASHQAHNGNSHSQHPYQQYVAGPAHHAADGSVGAHTMRPLHGVGAAPFADAEGDANRQQSIAGASHQRRLQEDFPPLPAGWGHPGYGHGPTQGQVGPPMDRGGHVQEMGQPVAFGGHVQGVQGYPGPALPPPQGHAHHAPRDSSPPPGFARHVPLPGPPPRPSDFVGQSLRGFQQQGGSQALQQGGSQLLQQGGSQALQQGGSQALQQGGSQALQQGGSQVLQHASHSYSLRDDCPPYTEGQGGGQEPAGYSTAPQGLPVVSSWTTPAAPWMQRPLQEPSAPTGPAGGYGLGGLPGAAGDDAGRQSVAAAPAAAAAARVRVRTGSSRWDMPAAAAPDPSSSIRQQPHHSFLPGPPQTSAAAAAAPGPVAGFLPGPPQTAAAAPGPGPGCFITQQQHSSLPGPPEAAAADPGPGAPFLDQQLRLSSLPSPPGTAAAAAAPGLQPASPPFPQQPLPDPEATAAVTAAATAAATEAASAPSSSSFIRQEVTHTSLPALRQQAQQCSPPSPSAADAVASLLAASRLCLVLDLDHTLLNSALFSEVSEATAELLLQQRLADEAARAAAAASGTAPPRASLELFRQERLGMWTKLRPGVREFLSRASQKFELWIHTNGNRSYAEAMAQLLDPEGRLFGGRIIAQGSSASADPEAPAGLQAKGFASGLEGREAVAVILDDSSAVWPNDRRNLLVVERYMYFPASRRKFGMPGRALLEANRDECSERGMLMTASSILDRIHAQVFANLEQQQGWRRQQGDELPPWDVRAVMEAERQAVLAGCHLVFSRVIPLEQEPRHNALWRMAEQFGATCSSRCSDLTTHVVANSHGTEKTFWALKHNRHVVSKSWLECSCLFWCRAAENRFPVPHGAQAS